MCFLCAAMAVGSLRSSSRILALYSRVLSGPISCLHVSASLDKNRRAGVPKITINKNKPLTYEQSQPPEKIGVTKSWNSWNTSSLHEEAARTSETCVEDIFVRKFIDGTWAGLFLSEIIIKRRHNMVIVAGLVYRGLMARKMYFLQGYTEEILSCILKCPVKMEIQTVEKKKDVIFKHI